ncbi:MAG: AAA family ATPase, partial [Ruminococcus sp.]|nr:AAA family ATPase [Ruminococcus sp.]
IKTCDTELQNILNKYMRRENEMKNYNIDDLIKIGLEKDSKLNDYWNGIRPYESESENDAGFMAKLLYWTNRDIETAIKYFKQSPYTSQKDEKHKKKLERVDYLARTANAVMPSTTALEDNEKWKLSNKANKITTKTDFNIISAQDLQNADLPPIEYIVDDILPVGTTLICAAPKIGKSWFVLNLGLNISMGYRFMHKPTKQIGVLYLALEDSYTRLQLRLSKYTSNAPDNFYFTTEAPRIDEGLFDVLDKQLEKSPDIKLLIIDTLEKIRG